ncbi:DUF3854 domain-containing protein [Nodosilinea sp. LEGE 06152]|uniref:DUF3854 domain-containing protein n=1 Tax=Nodosilinea sp. LEGE 06152 TaxID=2777966 RepID=UPI0018812FEC|nr:DUF3854 domain-containing protein [Nodosilinea sp. LEGE 06152]MBE9156495.1 DUF3854 domain-containing protein [Nodosilinea sp. LEGE 06152]
MIPQSQQIVIQNRERLIMLPNETWPQPEVIKSPFEIGSTKFAISINAYGEYQAPISGHGTLHGILDNTPLNPLHADFLKSEFPNLNLRGLVGSLHPETAYDIYGQTFSSDLLAFRYPDPKTEGGYYPSIPAQHLIDIPPKQIKIRSRVADKDIYKAKYLSTRKSGNDVYFGGIVALHGENAKSVLGNINKPLIIHPDGEKGVLAISNLGYDCIGFGGVNSWKCVQIREHELKALTDLRERCDTAHHESIRLSGYRKGMSDEDMAVWHELQALERLEKRLQITQALLNDQDFIDADLEEHLDLTSESPEEFSERLNRANSQEKRKYSESLFNIYDWITLKNREVTLVYDSDIKQKPTVMKAAYGLISHLWHKGAIVKLLYLPSQPGKYWMERGKLGVDDFIAQYGREGFDRLLNTAYKVEDLQRFANFNQSQSLPDEYVTPCESIQTVVQTAFLSQKWRLDSDKTFRKWSGKYWQPFESNHQISNGVIVPTEFWNDYEHTILREQWTKRFKPEYVISQVVANLPKLPPDLRSGELFQNGLLDSQGVFHPNHFVKAENRTFIYPFDYDTKATLAPNFDKAIELFHKGDTKLRRFVLAALRIAIAPNSDPLKTKQQVAFCITGQTNSGKSNFLKIINHLMGEQCYMGFQGFATYEDRNSLFQLVGKSVICLDEIKLEDFKDRIISRTVSAIAQGSEVEVKKLYQDKKTVKIQATQIFLTNDRIDQFKDGFSKVNERKLIPLKTYGRVKDGEKDINLLEKVQSECSAIYNLITEISLREALSIVNSMADSPEIVKNRVEYIYQHNDKLKFISELAHWINDTEQANLFQDRLTESGSDFSLIKKRGWLSGKQLLELFQIFKDDGKTSMGATTFCNYLLKDPDIVQFITVTPHKDGKRFTLTPPTEKEILNAGGVVRDSID